MWYGTPKFSTPLQEKSHGVPLCGWYSGVIIYPSWNLLRQLRLHLSSLYLLALLVDSEASSLPSSLQLSRICREICALLPMTIQPHTFFTLSPLSSFFIPLRERPGMGVWGAVLRNENRGPILRDTHQNLSQYLYLLILHSSTPVCENPI